MQLHLLSILPTVDISIFLCLPLKVMSLVLNYVCRIVCEKQDSVVHRGLCHYKFVVDTRYKYLHLPFVYCRLQQTIDPYEPDISPEFNTQKRTGFLGGAFRLCIRNCTQADSTFKWDRLSKIYLIKLISSLKEFVTKTSFLRQHKVATSTSSLR